MISVKFTVELEKSVESFFSDNFNNYFVISPGKIYIEILRPSKGSLYTKSLQFHQIFYH